MYETGLYMSAKSGYNMGCEISTNLSWRWKIQQKKKYIPSEIKQKREDLIISNRQNLDLDCLKIHKAKLGSDHIQQLAVVPNSMGELTTKKYHKFGVLKTNGLAGRKKDLKKQQPQGRYFPTSMALMMVIADQMGKPTILGDQMMHDLQPTNFFGSSANGITIPIMYSNHPKNRTNN